MLKGVHPAYSNVGIHGYSIGSNDLIQLTLGCDRDNQVLAGCGYLPLEDKAVHTLIQTAISEAHRSHAQIGLCGEAACDPSFLKVLMDMGIDYVSVNPTSVVKTLKTAVILEEKKRLKSVLLSEEKEEEEEAMVAAGMPMATKPFNSIR